MNIEIGQKIKDLRLSKNMKVVELAKKAHISQPYLSDIEKGRTTPSLDKLSSICDALDITLAEFFGSTSDHPPDFLQLIETAKKLSAEDRKLLIQFITNFKGIR